MLPFKVIIAGGVAFLILPFNHRKLRLMTHQNLEHADPELGRPLAKIQLGNRVAELRSTLERLGFAKEDFMGCLRYKGRCNDRLVTILVAARSSNQFITPGISRGVYQGISLEIQVASRLDTYLMMTPHPLKMPWLLGFLQRFNSAKRLDSLPTVCGSWRIWARHAEWAYSLFAKPPIQDRLCTSALGPADGPPFTILWKPQTVSAITSSLPGEISGRWCQQLIVDICGLADDSETEEAASIAPES